MIFLINSGCYSIAWIGYDTPVTQPPPGSYELVEGDCFSVGTQNLDEGQREAVMEAASEVCRIFSSIEFEQRVKSQAWLANCDGDNGSPETVSGEDVYALLQEQVPDYSVNPRKPWMAIAQAQKSVTNHAKNRIAIAPSRISAWHSGDIGAQGNLINTMAHEITHLISFQFRDRGHGSPACNRSQLVSYEIGNLVEELAK